MILCVFIVSAVSAVSSHVEIFLALNLGHQHAAACDSHRKCPFRCLKFFLCEDVEGTPH